MERLETPSSIRGEVEPDAYDEYGPTDIVVLDIDRTSIQSDNLSGYAYQALVHQYPEHAEAIVEVAEDETQHRGKAYEYLRLVQERGVPVDPILLAEQVLAENREGGKLRQEFIDQVLVDGVADYVRKVHECGASILFKTAGDATTQLFKIHLLKEILKEVAGVSIDSYILTKEGKIAKATMLSHFYNPSDQTFHFETEVAADIDGIVSAKFSPDIENSRQFRRVTLVDDKVKHHEINKDHPAADESVMRKHLVVATGLAEDGLARKTMVELAERVRPQEVDKSD